MADIDKSYFIENRTASTLEWLWSKGTNYQCYLEFNSKLTKSTKLSMTVENIKIIFSIFVLGDILKKIGDLWPNYYANKYDQNNQLKCNNNAIHPIKWMLQNELANVFSLLGEIFGDLYFLLRIKEISNIKREIKFIFLTCMLFNLSKLFLIIYKLTIGPADIYDSNGVYRNDLIKEHNIKYILIQLIVTYTSVIYSISICIVIKKYIYQRKYLDHNNIIRKFKNISEFRILISSIFNIIAMSLISIANLSQLIYNKKYKNTTIDFTMEELRDFLASIQYFMIYIDQILLFYSQILPSSSVEVYSSSYNYKYSNNSGISSGKFHYENLNHNNLNNDLLIPENNNNINNNSKNDNKYKQLTSYYIDYNEYNRMSKNNKWNNI
ncbi:hypothetical protein BCR32DRAFT_280269 [Anaeromyces robustus]|uniref:Uncharacterized protein n=1 Tax=Anaeromyces robustus TaxID=1754192 RepID=A0A1Y1X4M6_9FUNG|nr:hypothetical protein BCR32DRAFT_280269 [Anaeromyces robustus]|eukprot:ORX80770.1 hypothetical protein BCR32DRAFT_280269 [Anaeromyces robustus]